VQHALPAAPFGQDVIESILPHRPPFLLIDEVTELEPGRRVAARREVRVDDWWFPGHFPERAVMPGVLSSVGTPRPTGLRPARSA
jgi:3-hydroxyacyl-[acyl-carrier-protein] dehydratase